MRLKPVFASPCALSLVILAGFPELMPTRVPPRMDKTYQPHAIETSWYQTWESENYFAPQGAGESYTIMIP
ncbi:hypothetical protein CEJ63_22355, partial [Acinetobacter baumannii]